MIYKPAGDRKLSKQEEEYLVKGAMYTGLAYMLMECSDSYLMTAVELLDKVDCVLPVERRTEILMSKDAVKQARDTLNHVSKPLYNCKEADLLIGTSDWLLDCIHHIVTHTQSNEYARQDILRYIRKYNKKIKTK